MSLRIFYLTQEQFDAYDQRLKPQERFTDSHLMDHGIKNRKCGIDCLVVSPEKAVDVDLPSRFYQVMENPIV